MVLLAIENLSKSFDGLTALSGINFQIEEGEIVGLIGPNGAGKTTLMNVISGVYPPSSGRIFFKGSEISGLPPYSIARFGIGRTFQIEEPFRSLTTVDNVAIGALFGTNRRKASVKEAVKEAKELLTDLGLQKSLNSPVNELSIRERKKMELAKVLAMRPELLMLDELMAGLNYHEIEEIIELIKRVNQSRVSIIIIEHVMKAIMAVSQRIIVLHHGSMIADAHPEKVVNDETVIKAYLGQRYGASRK
jgi:branched-chain amino acid transport system ATP-binding protein